VTARESAAEESDTAQLHRIDFAGAAWFAAAVIAAAIPLGGLLSTGWRPGALPVPADVAWWAGTTLVILGIAALAWAGCPVLGMDLDKAVKQKSLSIRVGLAMFGVGGVLALFCVLSTPA
jgi:hypothetical protein